MNAETGTSPTLDDLVARARAVLDAAWIGASSLPSRTLYPHQWSWDSAFIALGRSWYDQPRAQQELETLFRAQWSNGMVPHIVFNPSVAEDAYFPGPAFWQSSTRSPHAPRDVETSGITQPTIHAHAALEMHRHAHDPDASVAFLRWLYPRLVAQHRYMLDARRPAGTRLAVMVHPWESGLDNSPAWDRALDASRHPARRRPAVPATRPRPWRPEGPPHERGVRPVRLSRRPVPRLRLRRCAPRRRRPVPRRRADVQRDPRLVAVGPGGDRIGRRRGPDAPPRGRAGSPCRDHRRALASVRRVGCARSRSPAASAASRTRSSRSRRSSTLICRPRSSTPSCGTCDRRASIPTGRTATSSRAST